MEVEEGIVGIKGNGEKSPIKMNCLERGGKGRERKERTGKKQSVGKDMEKYEHLCIAGENE